MGDMKDKMKDFMKKVNNPFSNSSASSFKGQGRVLGSSSSSSSIPSNSTLLNRRPSPARPNARPVSRPIPKPSDPDPTRFSPYDPLISSSASNSTSIASVSPFQCPICARSFPSESDVSTHLDSCLIQHPKPTDPTKDVSFVVSEFLSGDPAESSVEIMKKLLGNVAREPSSKKFRRIRMGNPKIREAISESKGGIEILDFVGFRIGEEEGEIWATMEFPNEERINTIKNVVDLLDRWKRGVDPSFNIRKSGNSEDSDEEKSTVKNPSEQSSVLTETKKIDREVKVYFCTSETQNLTSKIELPDSFYNVSSHELRREAENRRKKLADSQLLIPKSYREKQALAMKKRYCKSLVRIQFPDGVILQGVFLPSEPTSALYEFVSGALKEPSLEFELLRPAVPKLKVVPSFVGTKSLEEEELVPSALLKFKPVENESVFFTGLKDEFLEKSEPLN